MDLFSGLSGEHIREEETAIRAAWEDARIRSEERDAARARLGEEWARRLVIDAKRRAGSASKAAREGRMTPTQRVLAERRAERKQRRAGRRTA